MKKLAAVAMVLALTVTSLAGCGAEPAAESTATAGSSVTEATAESQEDSSSSAAAESADAGSDEAAASDGTVSVSWYSTMLWTRRRKDSSRR